MQLFWGAVWGIKVHTHSLTRTLAHSHSHNPHPRPTTHYSQPINPLTYQPSIHIGDPDADVLGLSLGHQGILTHFHSHFHPHILTHRSHTAATQHLQDGRSSAPPSRCRYSGAQSGSSRYAPAPILSRAPSHTLTHSHTHSHPLSLTPTAPTQNLYYGRSSAPRSRFRCSGAQSRETRYARLGSICADAWGDSGADAHRPFNTPAIQMQMFWRGRGRQDGSVHTTADAPHPIPAAIDCTHTHKPPPHRWCRFRLRCVMPTPTLRLQKKI